MSRLWRLEEKIAQLFFIGSDSPQLEDELEPFYRVGLGGLLLFRHHFQGFSAAADVQAYLAEQRTRFQGSGLSFIGVDQEGGQVERLPHWLFPTGLNPVIYGLKHDPLFCEQVNREMARRLRWLGINVNFTPTVDLNRERLNPIIGVRSYGASPQAVLPFAQAVVRTHWDAGVLPVVKHFPGHGSGTVDSHLALPVFDGWLEDELTPFQQLIAQQQCPAVMVAHGLYPQLFRLLGADATTPASLSKPIITRLLRDQLGFKGLVFSDDLMMAAVYENAEPLSVAIQALQAGANMLVYRRAQPEAWQVFEGLVDWFKRGKLPESLLEATIERLTPFVEHLRTVERMDYSPQHFDPHVCHTQALAWAKAGLVNLKSEPVSPIPFSHRTRWALVAPDRSTMVHYAPDAQHGIDWLGLCKEYGILPAQQWFYPLNAVGEVQPPFMDWVDDDLDVIVFIGFNSHIYTEQKAWYDRLKHQHPNTRIILASAGMPADGEELSGYWLHVQMPSYRPAAMHALVNWLITPPQALSSVGYERDEDQA